MDDDVFALIRRLVEQGEYVDFFRAKPAPDAPPPPPPLPDGTPDHRARIAWRRANVSSKTYFRGSADYEELRRLGRLEPPPPLTPATPEQVADAERRLKVALPPLLKRLYLEVGNGGFGPLSGIPGVEGGKEGSDGDLVEANEFMAEEPGLVPWIPAGVLCFFNWGGPIWSMLDCRTPDGVIWYAENEELEPTGMTLADWFRLWADHRLQRGRALAPGLRAEW